MKIKIKDEWKEAFIYIPQEKRDVMGKFIDPALYPFLYKKYPIFFEIEKEEIIKLKNDIHINDTKFSSVSDVIGKSK